MGVIQLIRQDNEEFFAIAVGRTIFWLFLVDSVRASEDFSLLTELSIEVELAIITAGCISIGAFGIVALLFGQDNYRNRVKDGSLIYSGC